jgi:hypothetical protein
MRTVQIVVSIAALAWLGVDLCVAYDLLRAAAASRAAGFDTFLAGIFGGAASGRI